MDSYRIDKFLFELPEDRASVDRLSQGDQSLFQGYDLTPEETNALSTFQARTLFEWGVHPLLLMKLSILLKQDLQKHYQKPQAGNLPTT